MHRALRMAFERMVDVQTAVQALQEAEVFRQKLGEFGTEMAQRMATDPKTSPCKCCVDTPKRCQVQYRKRTDRVASSLRRFSQGYQSTEQVSRVRLTKH